MLIIIIIIIFFQLPLPGASTITTTAAKSYLNLQFVFQIVTSTNEPAAAVYKHTRLISQTDAFLFQVERAKKRVTTTLKPFLDGTAVLEPLSRWGDQCLPHLASLVWVFELQFGWLAGRLAGWPVFCPANTSTFCVKGREREREWEREWK